MLGLIYAHSKLKRLMQHNQHKSELFFYQKLANLYQVDLCIFSMKHLSIFKNKRINAYIYHHRDHFWGANKVKIPHVNLCLCSSHPKNKTYIDVIRHLEKQGIKFIHVISRNTFEYASAQILNDNVSSTAEQTFINEGSDLRRLEEDGDDFYDYGDKDIVVKYVSDEICGNISLDNSNRIVLWESFITSPPPTGSVSIYFGGGCDSMDAYINGEFIFSISEGQTRSVTIPNIYKFEVQCKNNEQISRGKYCISIHYPCN